METKEVSGYIGKVREEIKNLRGDALNDIVEKAIQKHKIGINQLDNSIKNYIMENSGTAKQGMVIIRHGDIINLTMSCGQEVPVMHEDSDKIATDILAGNNVYLYGKAGTGKTYLGKQIAEIKLGRGFELITCSQWTSPINIIGGETIVGFRQGTLVKAWKKGKILILDELPKLDANTAGLLNEALAQTGEANSSCPLHYEGKLGIGTKVFTISSKDKSKKFVEGVWGIADADNDYYYTFFWVEKISEQEGQIIAIEEDFVEYTENNKLKRVFKSGDDVLKFITITDGSGKKQPRHPFFGVIGTGNTDMKTLTNDYSGNNRQDYSLVDRFAGSFYKIDYSYETEEKLIFSHVRAIATILRSYIDTANVAESVSLRTMLNFNRIFIAEMLVLMDSPLKMKGISYNEVKKLNDSVNSFLITLNEDLQAKINANQPLQELMSNPPDHTTFANEFSCIFEVNAETGEKIERTKVKGEKESVKTCVTAKKD